MPQMVAPVLYRPGRFRFESVKRPEAAQLHRGDALVRVLVGGICGSDGPYFRGDTTASFAVLTGRAPAGYPMHEIVGEVVAIATGAEDETDEHGLRVGDQVVGWATRFDGLADYVITSTASLARFDRSLRPDQAILIQPLACVLYAVERLGPVAGLRCAVIGLGPIGLLFSHVLSQRGARVVVGVDRVDRSAVAADFSVDEYVWSGSEEWAAGVSDNERPDVVVEAVGHQVSTLRHALSAVAQSGRIFYFGVNDDDIYPLDMSAMLRKNLALMSGGTLDRSRMLAEADRYLRHHPDLIATTITHRFGRSQVQEAYELALSPTAGRLKVVVRVADDAAVDT